MKKFSTAKKIPLYLMLFVASAFLLSGCQKNTDTLVPEQTNNDISTPAQTQSQESMDGKTSFDRGEYKVTIMIPEGWQKSGEWNFTKEDDELIFDPDYTPGETQDKGMTEKDLTTDEGKTLHVTQYPMDKGYFMVIKDANNPDKENHFEFNYLSKDKKIDADFEKILKSVIWEKVLPSPSKE